MGDPTRPMALTRWVVASTFSLLLIGALVAFNSSERTLPSVGSSFDVQDPTSELFSSARSGLNVVKENAPGVGGWGGSCTCPDGSTYWVGDKNDECRSMACYGGTRGTCNRYDSNKWKGRDVTCAASYNVVRENAPGVGTWGGWCTCPDGSTYGVSDYDDACRSMACYGGTHGTCNRYSSNKWKGREVICAARTANPTALPTANPTASVAPSDTPAAAPSAEHMRRRRRKVEQEEEDN